MNAPNTATSPEQVTDTSALLASVIRYADTHYAREDWQAARDFLSLAVEIDPAYPRLLGALGSLQFQLQEYPAACATFSAAVRQHADDPDLHIQLAMVQLKLGQPGAAESALKAALGLCPGNPTALKLLADLKRDLGSYREAGPIYRSLINQHPDQTGILLSLAKCRLELGDQEGSIAALEMLQELRTTGKISERIDEEAPPSPVCAASNHQVGQERVAPGTGCESPSTASAANIKHQPGQDSPRPPRRPYKEFFASLDWRPDRMVMQGVEFFLQHAVDATGGKRGQGFLFYKTPELVQQYEEYFEKLESFSPEHVFELGLWDGGSAVFWHECFHPKKHVAIDIQARTDCPGLDRYRADSGATESLITHWQTDQSDTARLRDLVNGELGSRLDLVIDDASHLYPQTRASFEALFPFLRPGGIYIIEDWAWGHWTSFQAADHPWKDEIPLTRLITELVEIAGASTALVRTVDVRQGFVAITRGAAPMDQSANLRLETLISRKAVWY